MFFLSTEQRYWHFSWRVPAQARCVVHFLTCKGVWPAFRTRNTKYNIWLDKVEYYIFPAFVVFWALREFFSLHGQLETIIQRTVHVTTSLASLYLKSFASFVWLLVYSHFHAEVLSRVHMSSGGSSQIVLPFGEALEIFWDIGTDSMREVHIWRTAFNVHRVTPSLPSRCANFFLIWEEIKGPRLGFLSMFWTCTPKCGKKCRSLAWP